MQPVQKKPENNSQLLDNETFTPPPQKPCQKRKFPLENFDNTNQFEKIVYSKINPANALKLLKDIQKILKTHQMPYVLMEGTLLGAIREQNFIPHDTDIDIVIPYTEEFRFVDTVIPACKAAGFQVLRYGRRSIISLLKYDEYIDFYVLAPLRKHLLSKLLFYHSYAYLHNLLFDRIWVDFLGTKVPVPRQYKKVLKLRYGTHWRIPKAGVEAPDIELLFFKKIGKVIFKQKLLRKILLFFKRILFSRG